MIALMMRANEQRLRDLERKLCELVRALDRRGAPSTSGLDPA